MFDVRGAQRNRRSNKIANDREKGKDETAFGCTTTSRRIINEREREEKNIEVLRVGKRKMHVKFILCLGMYLRHTR